MTFFAILFWAAYLGTPLLIVVCWLRLPKSSARRPWWPLPTALGLWALQFMVWLVMVASCVSGHCRLTALQEYGPYALTVLVYAAIGWLLWFAWRWNRPGGRTSG